MGAHEPARVRSKRPVKGRGIIRTRPFWLKRHVLLNDTNQASTHPAAGGPRVVARDEHPISRANISSNALKVLYRLQDAGFQAFLVGGAVRDLLLGLHPKDFDIATNAHPDEVQAAVPQLPADRPALPSRARALRLRDHRGRDVSRGAHADRRGQQRRRRRASRARRARPHPARQPLRHDRRRRLAPRLHRQRAVLQHRRLLGVGLRRRRRGRAQRASCA